MMWARSIQIYRLIDTEHLPLEQLAEALETYRFQPCSETQARRLGWSAPSGDSRNGCLVHEVSGHRLITLMRQERILPAPVIRDELAERVDKLTAQQGYPPGRRDKLAMKERIVEELLPKAFTKNSRTDVWIDLVQADLEGTNYASAAADLCAAGVGAPHIRQRLWFVAERLGDTDHAGLEGRWRMPERADQFAAGPGVVAGGLADTAVIGDQRKTGTANHERQEAERPAGGAGRCGSAFDGLGDTDNNRSRRYARSISGKEESAGGKVRCESNAGESPSPACRMADIACQRCKWAGTATSSSGRNSVESGSSTDYPGPVNGFWSDADWIGCRDGKWRPVRSGTQPLAHEPAARVGRLRAYGNAIVAEVAATVVASYLDIERNRQPSHPLGPKVERWVKEIEQGESA